MNVGDVRIRRADGCDLDRIKLLCDANRKALGFVLRSVIGAGIRDRRVMVADHDSHGVIGFIHYRHRCDRQTTIYEICVDEVYRGSGVGEALIQGVAAEGESTGQGRLRLKAPVDIPANCFYSAVGFILVGTDAGRGRLLNIWEYLGLREDKTP